MLGNDEIEDRIKDLENKVDALLLEIENNADELEELRETVEEAENNNFNDDQYTEPPFQVHWIKPEDTDSFSSCSDIDDLDKAKVAFKEAAVKRDSSTSFRPVKQGDILVLLCDTNPEPEENEEEEEESEPPPACYYIGMCVKINRNFQLEIPSDSKDLGITESQLADGEDYREFFAWSSCGGGGETPSDFGCEPLEICDPDSSGGTRTIYVATHSEPCDASSNSNGG